MSLAKAVLARSVAAVVTAFSDAAGAQSQQPPVKNIVLVHDAFADGSWTKVVPILEKRGFHVVAVQNPLTSLSDDANATRRIIAMQDGPVILVGNSWGGAVISEVGDDPKVAGLVYVAAFASDVGTSANETSAPFASTPGQQAIKVDSQHFASPDNTVKRRDRLGRLVYEYLRVARCKLHTLHADRESADSVWSNSRCCHTY